jgi:nucleotide-binding universal stress UspA family protein
MKIILAIDSSGHAKAMAGEIAARPWPEGTLFCVLHVVDLFTLTSGFTYSTRIAATASESAEAAVRSIANILSAAGLEVVTDVIEGYPRTSIVEFASEWDADLIVVGSHGHGALVRFLLGSVAKEVVRAAPCSVEVVRRPNGLPRSESSPMKILVATDNSDCSRAAVRSVSERPWPAGSEVKVLSAIDTTPPTIEPWYGALDLITRMEADRAKLARDGVSEANQLLSSAGLAVTPVVIESNPRLAIIDIAREWEAHLIVVGSHGRRGVSRVLLGSVSEAVALGAPCSVEVFREKHSSKR